MMPASGPLSLRGVGPARDIFPQGPAFRAARASRPPPSKKLAPIRSAHHECGRPGLRPLPNFGCLSCNAMETGQCRPRSTPAAMSRDHECTGRNPPKPKRDRRSQIPPAHKGARLWSASALESLKENIVRLEQKGCEARRPKATPRGPRVTFGPSPVTIELALGAKCPLPKARQPQGSRQTSTSASPPLPAPTPTPEHEPASLAPLEPPVEPTTRLDEPAPPPRGGCTPEENLRIPLPRKEVLDASWERGRTICAHRKLQQKMKRLMLQRRRALIEEAIPESPCQSQFSSFNSDLNRSASKEPPEKHETSPDDCFGLAANERPPESPRWLLDSQP